MSLRTRSTWRMRPRTDGSSWFASGFPNRDNILSDIVGYLHEIGRVVDIPTVDDEE